MFYHRDKSEGFKYELKYKVKMSDEDQKATFGSSRDEKLVESKI